MSDERKEKAEDMKEYLQQIKNTFRHIISLLEEGISTNKKARMELDYIEKQIIEKEINANIQQKLSVSKTRLDECVEEGYLDLKALMYELGVEITPRTKPVPQPIEKPEIKDEEIKEELETLDVTIEYFKEHMKRDPNRQYPALKPRVEVLKRLIQRLQQKPEIDEKYVNKKTDELFYHLDELFEWKQLKEYVTQIVSDARGGKA